MAAVFEIQGLAAARRATDATLFRAALRASGEDAVEPARAETQRTTPVGRTGQTAAQIRTEVRDRGADLEIVIGSGKRTAHLVERGHAIVARSGASGNRSRLARLAAAAVGRTVIGFVPGRFFAETAWRESEPAVQLALETNLALAMGWQ